MCWEKSVLKQHQIKADVNIHRIEGVTAMHFLATNSHADLHYLTKVVMDGEDNKVLFI